MENFLKFKRKKSPEPPLRPISPGDLAGITAGPSGSQGGLDPVCEGGRVSYRDCS